MSIHCPCYDTALIYLKRFVQNFWRVEKYVPFRLGRTFLCLKVLGNRSDIGTSQVLIYMDFKFHELWLMPKVSSNSLCV